VTQGVISALEKRDSLASRHAASIAAAFGVTLNDLMGDAIEPPNPTRQQILIKLFDGLTKRQQDEVIQDILETKQKNDELLVELKRKA